MTKIFKMESKDNKTALREANVNDKQKQHNSINSDEQNHEPGK